MGSLVVNEAWCSGCILCVVTRGSRKHWHPVLLGAGLKCRGLVTQNCAGPSQWQFFLLWGPFREPAWISTDLLESGDGGDTATRAPSRFSHYMEKMGRRFTDLLSPTVSPRVWKEILWVNVSARELSRTHVCGQMQALKGNRTSWFGPRDLAVSCIMTCTLKWQPHPLHSLGAPSPGWPVSSVFPNSVLRPHPIKPVELGPGPVSLWAFSLDGLL